MAGTSWFTAIPAFAQDRINFEIAAQPLSAALLKFSERSGLQLVFNADTLRSVSSPGVTGAYQKQKALAALMAGTGLGYRVSGNTVIIVDRVADAFDRQATDATQLDPIVVISQRGAKDAPYETPGAVSFISAEDLERLPPTSLGDIFKSAPGVIAPGSRVGASVDVNIRGLQGQNRVNVMVDGTRQSNHTYRGYRGSRTEVYVDPDFLGGVDIAKGPVATAGGVGAMGGVINMRTLEASDVLQDGRDYGVRVKGGFGSNTVSPPRAGKSFGNPADATLPRDTGSDLLHDSWSGNVVGAAVNENYEFVAGFSRRAAGNYFAGSNGRSTYASPVYDREVDLSPFQPGKEVFNTSQDITSFIAKGKVHWGDAHSLGLGYIYYDNVYGEMDENFLPYIRSGGGSFYRIAQHELSKTRTHTLKSTYEYRPEGNDLVALTANFWLTDVTSQSNVIRAYSGGTGPGGTLLKPIETGIRTLGGDFSNDTVLDTAMGALTLNNGVEYVHERASENGGQDTWSGTYRGANPNGDRTLASVFNRTSLEATDWLTVFGGLRYDYYHNESKHASLSGYAEKSGARLHPSVGVTLEPLDGLQLFGTYTAGWRPPSLRETAVRQASGVWPNPDLRPETSSNFEFGVNVLRDGVFLAGDTLRFKASYFDNTHDDYVVRERFIDPDGFWRYHWGNIEKAKFKGYEFSASYDAPEFFVQGGLTLYSEATFCRDKPANLITLVIPAGCGLDRVAFDYGVMNVPPKYSGNVTAGVHLLEETATLGGRVYFFGQRFGGFSWHKGSANEAPYYYPGAIVDLFGSYKLREDAVLNFSVENVADQYYLDPLSTGLVPAPGRTFRLNLTMNF